MKIILVGSGKVGTALARQLSEEGHNVTVVDTNKARVEHLIETYDVLGIVGNGSSITTLSEAGIEDADVFIAVTGSDELNLLCCMFAKKAGHCHAIARVRNPSYSHELDFIKKQIGISAIINPEMAAAKEISHLLRFPGASKIDTFAGGRVRLIKFALTEAQGLDGVAIREIPSRLKSDILVCAVERDGGVIIPNGNFVLQNGDQVTFLATQEHAHAFFRQIHMPVRPVRNALIVGGGAIAFYLSQELLDNHVRVRIVERDAARAQELAEQLPMSQSKLVLGFRTGLPQQRRARTALRVMTALLGGSTGSRLFTNVRERLGCCYYCGARVNLLTGILLIECGLEEANRERLQSAILAEIADLAAGHITPQELSHIKLAFQSSLCSIGDSLARTEGRYLSGLLQGDPITPQQDMEEIASITAEEVAAAAAALTLDTVFFLQAVGKEDGCDED